jgi:hypothetical protein
VTLRALLDASGRTPPDVAAGIGIGAARALALLHAAPGAGPEKTAHVALDPAAIRLSRGEVSLAGGGLPADGDPAADLRALGAALHECLAGEPPGAPPRRLEIPGVPASLAAVVDRASGAALPGYASAVALAEAIADAVAAPATPDEVAAYVDAVVLPEEEEQRAPAVAAPASPDSVRTFPRPAAARSASWRLPVVVGIVALAAGFVIGYRARRALRPAPPPAVEPAGGIEHGPEQAPAPAGPR